MHFHDVLRVQLSDLPVLFGHVGRHHLPLRDLASFSLPIYFPDHLSNLIFLLPAVILPEKIGAPPRVLLFDNMWNVPSITNNSDNTPDTARDPSRLSH